RPVHCQRILPESERLQPSCGLLQFDSIDINSDEPAPRLDRRKQLRSMTAIPERAVDDEFARLGSKNFEDLANHDRTMRACRRLSSGNHLSRGAGIELRRELFVLLRKMSRIFAFVSRSPLGPF